MNLEFPGFIDVHVHFRDPGTPAAETTASGLASASRGGFSAVVTMPNTEPACDSAELIRYQHSAAVAAADSASGPLPRLLVSACISKSREGREVADLEALAEAGAVFFTDDGSFVSDSKVMEAAMRRIYDLNMVVCQHALASGVSEADAIRRDLSLCRVTGCRLHIQHISTAPGVELVREAQREGLPVTAEATPHHLLLCRDDIVGADGNFKMAPPLAGREDRAELRRAVKDGILMFATDHAPHTAERKNCGWENAANGIIGLETAVAITYGVMVEEEGMPVDEWARAWSEMPRSILAVKDLELAPAKLVVGERKAVDIGSFASLSRNCPYHGMEFSCWPVKGE